MIGVLNRLKKSSVQTLGHLTIYDGITELFECKVLELPDKENLNRISRIPDGEYTCTNRWSEKYGNHYHVLDVIGRTLILLHSGNYHTQTKGCLLLGKDYYDINNDGHKDVTSSKETMKKLMNATNKKQFKLIINDYENK